MATLAIVIVTWNSRDEIGPCLRALGAMPPEWQVWVVDNASTDGTPDRIRAEFPDVHLIANAENVGFARANNQAIAATDTEFVLLLNPDTEASPAAVQAALAELAAQPRAGMVAVQLRNTDGSLQPSCSRFPTPWISFLHATGLYFLLPRRRRAAYLIERWWDHSETRAVDWVMGAFMLVPRAVIEQVGPVPENTFMYAEDMEWCHRIWKAGYEVRFVAAASILHHSNRSGGQKPSEWRAELTHRGKYDFCRRVYGRPGMRFIQLMDLIGYSARLWRYRVAAATEMPCAAWEWASLGRAAVLQVWRQPPQPANCPWDAPETNKGSIGPNPPAPFPPREGGAGPANAGRVPPFPVSGANGSGKGGQGG